VFLPLMYVCKSSNSFISPNRTHEVRNWLSVACVMRAGGWVTGVGNWATQAAEKDEALQRRLQMRDRVYLSVVWIWCPRLTRSGRNTRVVPSSRASTFLRRNHRQNHLYPLVRIKSRHFNVVHPVLVSTHCKFCKYLLLINLSLPNSHLKEF
jgi:hypothetical protein